MHAISVYTAGYLVNCHLSIHTHRIFKTLLRSYEAKVLSLVVYTCQCELLSNIHTIRGTCITVAKSQSYIEDHTLNSRECFEGHE
jgi:hypothetical protein